MAPEIRIAVSYHHDCTEVARQLKQKLLTTQHSQPAEWQPGWGLVFATERYQPQELLNGLRQQLGDIPLFGGAVIGHITHDAVNFAGFGVQLVLFPAEIPPPTPLLAEKLSLDPQGCGTQLGCEWQQLLAEKVPHSSTMTAEQQLAEQSGAGSHALLLYDQLTHTLAGQRNSGQSLIDGINSQQLLQPADAVTGFAALANETTSCSWLICGDRVQQDSAMLLVLPDGLTLHSAASHGNQPISRQLEVTATDGNQLLELEGRPALAVMQQLLDIDPVQYAQQPLNRLLSIGQVGGHGHLSRAIAGLDPARQALSLHDSHLVPGDKIQFMCRDQRAINHCLQLRLEQLDQTARRDDCLLAFYINCSGRYTVNISHEQEDARLLSSFWPQLPLCGLYTAGEITSMGDSICALNWSGVLALLCWQPAPTTSEAKER